MEALKVFPENILVLIVLSSPTMYIKLSNTLPHVQCVLHMEMQRDIHREKQKADGKQMQIERVEPRTSPQPKL